jgi:thiamine transporter
LQVSTALGTAALVGIATALAVVLSFFKVAAWPQGGEISLEMLPILFTALLRGAIPGSLCGALYGIIHCIQDPHVVHPVQYFLDYPAAYGVLGTAGLFRKIFASTSIAGIVIGVTAGVLGRFALHTLSGLFFFSSLQGSALTASLIYNSSYLVPEYLIAIALLPLLLRRMKTIG